MFTNNSPDRVSKEEGIVVGSAAGRELRVDVFLPPRPVANGAGVLLIHGGGWIGGDRTQLHGYGILLGRAGYTCVACEYRLAPDAKWPAQIDDVRVAFAWMREHAGELGIDIDKVAVEGNSAGGHLALYLAGTTSGVAACVAIYAPADLQMRHVVASTQARVSPVKLLMPSLEPVALAEASATTYVRADFPPAMLIHGNADQVVSVKQSLNMYEKLVDAGARAELHIFEGQPHSFDRESGPGRQCASLMELFFKRHVLGEGRGSRGEGQGQRVRSQGSGVRA
jgi:acetyl esterase/lipase